MSLVGTAASPSIPASLAVATARACLDILCGAAHLTFTNARELEALLVESLRGQGGEQRGHETQPLVVLQGLASCLQEIVTRASSAVEKVGS